MTYTVQLDFWIEEDVVRTDEQIEKVLDEIFEYASCYASNIKVIEVND